MGKYPSKIIFVYFVYGVGSFLPSVRVFMNVW